MNQIASFPPTDLAIFEVLFANKTLLDLGMERLCPKRHEGFIFRSILAWGAMAGLVGCHILQKSPKLINYDNSGPTDLLWRFPHMLNAFPNPIAQAQASYRSFLP